MAVSESEAGSPLSEMGSDALSDLEEDYKRRHSCSGSDMSDHDSADNMSVAASTTIGTPRRHHERPPKRRRIGASAYDHSTPQSSTLNVPLSPSGSISSDSSTELPFDSSFANLPVTHPLSASYHAAQKDPSEPDADHQMTTCLWDDCPHPEQDNLDRLVQHISNVHVVPKNKKFWCGWRDCTRKEIAHTSAYALRTHLRSHTKEKPFMCQVPECDRSFTRSDALAKHMRTVHETETLRDLDMKLKHGIDYAAKGVNGAAANTINNSNGSGAKKIKLILKNGAGKSTTSATNGEPNVSSIESKLEGPLPALPTVATHPTVPALALRKEERSDLDLMGTVHMDDTPFLMPPGSSYWPAEIYAEMDDYERTLAPTQYFRLLRRQTRWANDEAESLKAELRELSCRTDDMAGRAVYKDFTEGIEDVLRRQEWSVINHLLEQIVEAEVANAESPPLAVKNASVTGTADEDANEDADGEVDANNTKDIWHRLRQQHKHKRKQKQPQKEIQTQTQIHTADSPASMDETPNK